MLERKINELIEEKSATNPYKKAIVHMDNRITYQELNRKANQFANYLLKELKIKPGHIIPIVSEKSINSIIAILGILKAGAAYAPMNSESSQSRVEVVFNETKANLICMDSALITKFNLNATTVDLDKLDSLIQNYPDTNIKKINSKIDLAYVIYTSGTTGNPKGVMVNHANLIPTFISWQTSYNLTPEFVHLQMANFGFDVFVGDWVRALCSGATLILCPKKTLLDPEQLYELIIKEKVNCAEFVPAVLRTLMAFMGRKSHKLTQMDLLICGSDQWTMKEYRAVKAICGENTRVYSSYGLTETTIDSSFYKQTGTDNSLPDTAVVPIGKPFEHVKFRLLRDGKSVRPGEIGEMYIGGAGIAQGYLNRDELTAERFVVIEGVRYYKTGDKGCELPNGDLSFLGRNEFEVKVNGERVEIPTLEAVINEYPKVEFSVVIAEPKEDARDGVVLKCYMTLKDSSLNSEELIEYIHSKGLGCYYIPRVFYEIESIPLSQNNKVDRNNIASQKIVNELKPVFEPPKNHVQEKLIAIWKEVLNLDIKLSIKSNFFYLGGSSVTYVEMVNKVNVWFNIKLPRDQKFETIEAMGTQVEILELSLQKECQQLKEIVAEQSNQLEKQNNKLDKIEADLKKFIDLLLEERQCNPRKNYTHYSNPHGMFKKQRGNPVEGRHNYHQTGKSTTKTRPENDRHEWQEKLSSPTMPRRTPVPV